MYNVFEFNRSALEVHVLIVVVCSEKIGTLLERRETVSTGYIASSSVVYGIV